MKLAIGSDHAGFELKTELAAYLGGLGHDVLDVGTYNTDSVDYADFAVKVGEAVLSRSKTERGVLICGSGIGASVAANKLVGVRAGLCHDTYSAHQGVEHDDMNVIVLGARVVGIAIAQELVAAFVNAAFTNEERHVRRLNKVRAIEANRSAAA
jgi:RpiB/LacA/LacB family sugar-phosphate isomerase